MQHQASRRLALAALTATPLALALAGCTPSAPALTAAQQLAAYRQLAGMTVGSPDAPDKAVVFFDTQCPHCATLWDQFTPLIAVARVHWVPVRILGPASMDQAVALLEHPRPMSAFEDHKTRLRRREPSSLVPSSGRAKALQAQVQESTDALVASGAKSVPTVFYLDAQGSLQRFSGAVPTSELRERLNLR